MVVRHIISFQKILSPKFPRGRGVGGTYAGPGTNMCDDYQQDGVGLGPLLELVDLQNKCDRSFNFNWPLQALKKQLYHSCGNDVVSA